MLIGYMIKYFGYFMFCLVLVVLCFLNFLVVFYILEILFKLIRKFIIDIFVYKLG